MYYAHQHSPQYRQLCLARYPRECGIVGKRVVLAYVMPAPTLALAGGKCFPHCMPRTRPAAMRRCNKPPQTHHSAAQLQYATSTMWLQQQVVRDVQGMLRRLVVVGGGDRLSQEAQYNATLMFYILVRR
jgi:RNA polymerase Rpb1, domain 6